MKITTEKPAITAKNYLTVGPGEYSCGNHLYLIVATTGGRRWSFRYQRNGIVNKLGLGSAKATGLKLKEATAIAIDMLRLLSKGIDPKKNRDEQRRAEGGRLFGEFAEEWRQRFETGLKHQSSRNKLKRVVQVICKPLHKVRLDEIETAHVIKVLDTVWHQREVSRDVRQRIKKIMDAAIAHDLTGGKANPADWDSRLEPIMPKQPKRGSVRGSHKAMDYCDLPAFMEKLAAIPDQSARALEITILTLVRTNETQNMQWSQLDLETGLWDLAGNDMKNERAKRTPLPRQTLAYLREAYESRVSNFVFPGRDLKGPMSNMTMLTRLKDITGDDELTVHGFRTTFRTWAQEETDFAEEIVEHCLHHITGDEAEKAYKRGEALKKRRVVMQAFADFVMRPLAKVLPIKVA
jgi:integrase